VILSSAIDSGAFPDTTLYLYLPLPFLRAMSDDGYGGGGGGGDDYDYGGPSFGEDTYVRP
jgi:hypothetical protein